MAARIHLRCNTLAMVSLLIALASLLSATEATKTNNINGLSIDLIHRDSPESPLYNPRESPLQRYNNMRQRAVSRLNNILNSNQIAAQADVSADNGQYLMKFTIGTPPTKDIYALVDTGSDLMWVQCLPCEQCYKQTNPVYDPATSSSFQEISCQSQQCHLLDTVSCSSKQQCSYTYGYASALVKGVLATEKITLADASFDNIVFGCGHNNTGQFNEREMGLVGLGASGLSLTSQIGSRLGAHKFSMCLVPFGTDPSIKSKMHFGKGSEVSGANVVSTPLVIKDPATYYSVTMEGISVGNNKMIPLHNSSTGTISTGNVFFDSGTPPTLLPRAFYSQVEEQVRRAIKLTPYQDPALGTQLCYKNPSMAGVAPMLTAHFQGGAKVPLVTTSTFIHPPVEGVFCFGMLPIDGDVGIFGNFAQSNMLIGYDLESRTLSFKPTDCTQQ